MIHGRVLARAAGGPKLARGAHGRVLVDRCSRAEARGRDLWVRRVEIAGRSSRSLTFETALSARRSVHMGGPRVAATPKCDTSTGGFAGNGWPRCLPRQAVAGTLPYDWPRPAAWELVAPKGPTAGAEAPTGQLEPPRGPAPQPRADQGRHVTAPASRFGHPIPTEVGVGRLPDRDRRCWQASLAETVLGRASCASRPEPHHSGGVASDATSARMGFDPSLSVRAPLPVPVPTEFFHGLMVPLDRGAPSVTVCRRASAPAPHLDPSAPMNRCNRPWNPTRHAIRTASCARRGRDGKVRLASGSRRSPEGD